MVKDELWDQDTWESNCACMKGIADAMKHWGHLPIVSPYETYFGIDYQKHRRRFDEMTEFMNSQAVVRRQAGLNTDGWN